MFCKSDDIDVEEYLNSENFYEENLESTDKLTQGDIIIPYQSLINKEEYIGKNIIGVIIITNQCDIETGKANYVTFDPIYRTTALLSLTTKKEREEFKKVISQDHRIFFYLPPHPSIVENLGGVVYFENIRSERLDIFLTKNQQPILRLKRPLIDRLCSKIAYFFNRIPIQTPKKNKLEEWIKDNNLIKNISEMSKLQKNAGRYISHEDINKWIRENWDVKKCLEILNIYCEAQKFQKKEEPDRLKDILIELEKFEKPTEERFVKLKKDYERLVRVKSSSDI